MYCAIIPGAVLWWWMGLANDQPCSNATCYILQVTNFRFNLSLLMYIIPFSRFHSTVCLFEIWKKSFKRKSVDVNIVWNYVASVGWIITSPPSAQVAAMRFMLQQNCKTKLHRMILESPLKLFMKFSSNTLATFFKHPWNFLNTSMKLPWNILWTSFRYP